MKLTETSFLVFLIFCFISRSKCENEPYEKVSTSISSNIENSLLEKNKKKEDKQWNEISSFSDNSNQHFDAPEKIHVVDAALSHPSNKKSKNLRGTKGGSIKKRNDPKRKGESKIVYQGEHVEYESLLKNDYENVHIQNPEIKNLIYQKDRYNEVLDEIEEKIHHDKRTDYIDRDSNSLSGAMSKVVPTSTKPSQHFTNFENNTLLTLYHNMRQNFRKAGKESSKEDERQVHIDRKEEPDEVLENKNEIKSSLKSSCYGCDYFGYYDAGVQMQGVNQDQREYRDSISSDQFTSKLGVPGSRRFRVRGTRRGRGIALPNPINPLIQGQAHFDRAPDAVSYWGKPINTRFRKLFNARSKNYANKGTFVYESSSGEKKKDSPANKVPQSKKILDHQMYQVQEELSNIEKGLREDEKIRQQNSNLIEKRINNLNIIQDPPTGLHVLEKVNLFSQRGANIVSQVDEVKDQIRDKKEDIDKFMDLHPHVESAANATKENLVNNFKEKKDIKKENGADQKPDNTLAVDEERRGDNYSKDKSRKSNNASGNGAHNRYAVKEKVQKSVKKGNTKKEEIIRKPDRTAQEKHDISSIFHNPEINSRRSFERNHSDQKNKDDINKSQYYDDIDRFSDVKLVKKLANQKKTDQLYSNKYDKKKENIIKKQRGERLGNHFDNTDIVAQILEERRSTSKHQSRNEPSQLNLTPLLFDPNVWVSPETPYRQ